MSGGRDSRQVLNDPPPPAAEQRLVYGDEPQQFADLRRADATEPAPLIVLLHGGAWKATFNLIHAGHMAIALRERGYSTLNVEYRRVGDPGGGWPGSFHDVLAAVDFALELPGFDPNRVVLAGHSAGGHLALLAAAERKLPVVPMAAGSDLEAWESTGSIAFLNGGSGRDASPRARVPLGVRQVFIHGTEDDQVPYWLSTAFVDAAREAGDDARLVTLEGAGHFDMIDPQSTHWPTVLDVFASLFNGTDAKETSST
jgi:pimeloyl-ACP methyl ester carboxylesterase